jgi:hypothetical protein
MRGATAATGRGAVGGGGTRRSASFYAPSAGRAYRRVPVDACTKKTLLSSTVLVHSPG